MMRKTTLSLLLLTVVAVVALSALSPNVAAASTNCGLLNIDYEDNTLLYTNSTGSMAVVVTNPSSASQQVQLSAQCQPSQLDCSFDQSSVVLAAGEQRAFHLNVESKTATGSFAIPGELHGGISGQSCSAPLSFAAVVSDTPVSATSDITATVEPLTAQNVVPGDTASYRIDLKNNKNVQVYAVLTSLGSNPFESTTSLSATQVALGPSESKTITVTVTVPPGTPGGRFSWVYQLDASICCGQKTTLGPISLNVQGPVLDLDLQGAPSPSQCQVVTPFAPVSYDLALVNNGELTGPFDVAISAPTATKNALSISASRFTLQTGERAPFTLSIQPTKATPIGIHYYKVQGLYNAFKFMDTQLCFNVTGVATAQVGVPAKLAIERARTTVFSFNVTNNGSIADQYAVSINPIAKFQFNLQPSSFRLTPGQTQQVALSVDTALDTPLGNVNLPLIVDAQNYSRFYTLKGTVYPTGRLGESLLNLDVASPVRVAKGRNVPVSFPVRNLGTNPMQVTLEFDGVPQSWFTSTTVLVRPGAVEQLDAVFNVPESFQQDQLLMNVTARSGSEFVSVPALLMLSNEIGLTFTVTNVTSVTNMLGEIVGVDLMVTVQNPTNLPVEDVTAVFNSLDYLYTQQPASFSLQPGQSLNVKVSVRPATKNQESKTVDLRLASGVSATTSQPVALPTMLVLSNSLQWKLVLALLLLLGIFAIKAKDEKLF